MLETNNSLLGIRLFNSSRRPPTTEHQRPFRRAAGCKPPSAAAVLANWWKCFVWEKNAMESSNSLPYLKFITVLYQEKSMKNPILSSSSKMTRAEMVTWWYGQKWHGTCWHIGQCISYSWRATRHWKTPVGQAVFAWGKFTTCQKQTKNVSPNLASTKQRFVWYLLISFFGRYISPWLTNRPLPPPQTSSALLTCFNWIEAPLAGTWAASVAPAQNEPRQHPQKDINKKYFVASVWCTSNHFFRYSPWFILFKTLPPVWAARQSLWIHQTHPDFDRTPQPSGS